jgi:mRNA interferase YafQ
MYKVELTNRFVADVKLAKKRKLPMPELYSLIDLLKEDNPLPKNYKDHALKGNYIGYRECHILPDWLLVYKKTKKKLILLLLRTGSHADLSK